MVTTTTTHASWLIPQNTVSTAPIQNLGGNVQKLLNYRDCARVVQGLLDKAAEKFPKWKGQNSKTFAEAFDRIASQGGFVAEIPAEIQEYGGSVDGDAFASQDANHARQAIAYLHPFQYYGAFSNRINAQAQLHYAFTALHETFHLAARSGYSDKDMAEVVSEITGWALPPPGSAVTKYSQFWEAYLSEHCRPKYLGDTK